jgi:peptidoglycan/LPS O-acetylase OafA/YrhL
MKPHGVRHIASLDGIRASAAFLVFLSHAFDESKIPGSLGVTTFFFMSGYLITTLLRKEYEVNGHINLKHFYIRRACRILPPLYFVLTLILAITLASQTRGTLDGGAIAAQFAHITNYYIVFAHSDEALLPSTAVLWSLAVEEHFYFIFPPLILLLFSRFDLRRIACILVFLCVLAAAWRLVLDVGMNAFETHLYYATDTRFDSLLFGCIMALWCNPVMDFRMPDGDAPTPTTAEKTLLAAAIVLMALSLLYRNPTFHHVFRFSVQGLALFPMFWLAVRYPGWAPFRWLNWEPVRRFGVISYSFYLAHPFWLSVVTPHTAGLIRALLAFALTLAFSILLYWTVERPFLQLGKTLQSGMWPLRLKEPT